MSPRKKKKRGGRISQSYISPLSLSKWNHHHVHEGKKPSKLPLETLRNPPPISPPRRARHLPSAGLRPPPPARRSWRDLRAPLVPPSGAPSLASYWPAAILGGHGGVGCGWGVLAPPAESPVGLQYPEEDPLVSEQIDKGPLRGLRSPNQGSLVSSPPLLPPFQPFFRLVSVDNTDTPPPRAGCCSSTQSSASCPCGGTREGPPQPVLQVSRVRELGGDQ